ncbi:MAG: lytic murein transglycosylase B [Gallionellaceae bacterium]|nr:MAG: lytic murein transglycosylase B [Gallionellaceae bacterium]
MFRYFWFVTLGLSLLWSLAYAADLPGIPQFINEMVEKHQFKRDELVLTFQRAEYRPDVIAAITAPATIKPWVEYRAAFINPVRIEGGVEFWKQYATTLKRAEQQYGVPQEIIIAVIGVETLYGRRAGKFRTLDALTTLAFDYPRRAEFFRNELAEYLLLAREQEFNLLEIKASYAGALGVPQFMPSSYRKYAVDFNANGKIDLLREPEDAIGSVANYLKQYGWKTGEPIAQQAMLRNKDVPVSGAASRSLAAWAEAGVIPLVKPQGTVPPAWLLDFTVEPGKEYWLTYNNFRVITLYNNSNFYAMSVFQLAAALRAAYRVKGASINPKL